MRSHSVACSTRHHTVLFLPPTPYDERKGFQQPEDLEMLSHVRRGRIPMFSARKTSAKTSKAASSLCLASLDSRVLTLFLMPLPSNELAQSSRDTWMPGGRSRAQHAPPLSTLHTGKGRMGRGDTSAPAVQEVRRVPVGSADLILVPAHGAPADQGEPLRSHQCTKVSVSLL